MRAGTSLAAEQRALERLWNGMHFTCAVYALALLLYAASLCLRAVSACG